MNYIMKKTGRVISLLTLTVMVFTMVFSIGLTTVQAATLSDIETHWAHKEISNGINLGLISGYPDGTFKPNNEITRAEFATLVNRSFKFKETEVVTFKDVQESNWFYVEIAKALKAGYMNGYEDGTVKPNDNITRQEVACIIAKLKSLNKDEVEASKFADSDIFPMWSKGFIGAVAKSHYMKGYPDGKFEPTKSITRAESIVALNNIKTSDPIPEETIPEGGITPNPTPVVTATPMITATQTTTPTPTPTPTPVAAGGGSNGGGNSISTPTATPTPTSTSEITPPPSVTAIAKITVKVAENMPMFKSITVNSSTVGDKFKVEGSELVKAFGEEITVITPAATRLVYMLDANGYVLGTIIVNVESDNSKDFTFELGEGDTHTAVAKITADIAEGMPTFKNITVNSSTVGAKFKVEGSTLIKAFGEGIPISTSEATCTVSILDASGDVLGVITVNVGSDSSTDYPFTVGSTIPTPTPTPTSTPTPTPTTTPVPTLSGIAKITVDIAEAMPSFKNITVNTSTVGAKFQVEGSTAIKAFGETVAVNTSEAMRTVSILDEGGNVLGTTLVSVGSDSSNDYPFTVSSATPPPTSTPAPTSTPRAQVTVAVAAAMPAFKNITVNSSTVGVSFKVEGSTLVKAFGEEITVNTSEATRTVSILDASGTVLGTLTVNVASNSTLDYDVS